MTDKLNLVAIGRQLVNIIPASFPQHFPMYRNSDAECNTKDAAPPSEKSIPFKVRYDCLDQRSTDLVWLHPLSF